jgi:GGDEF domain-containing protein
LIFIMLDEEYRKKLDKILSTMAQENAPESDMKVVVDDFKSIYDPKARFDESDFNGWYQEKAARFDLSENPDDPRHFYNYRAAFRSGAEPDETGHWPSKFKKEGHPDLIIDGIDTRTGKEPDWDAFQNPTPYFESMQRTALAPKRGAQVTSAPMPVAEAPVENVRTEQMQLQGPEKQPEIMEPMPVVAGETQKPFTGDIKEAVKSFARNMVTGPRALQEMANERSFKGIVDKQKQLDELIARKTDAGLTPEDEKTVLRLGNQIDRESKLLQGNQKITGWLGRIEKSDLLKAKEVERLEGPAGFLQDVTQGLVQLGGQFLAHAVNPSLGAAAIAGQISGNTIATLEEYGVTKEEAAPLAILNSVVQYPLEKLGMGKIAKNVFRNSAPILRKMISSFITEGSTEGIQQIPDEILGQMWGETKGQTIEERAQYLKDHLGELAKSAGYAGLVGGVIGSTATGIGRTGARAAGIKPTPAPAVEPTPAETIQTEQKPVPVSPEAVPLESMPLQDWDKTFKQFSKEKQEEILDKANFIVDQLNKNKGKLSDEEVVKILDNAKNKPLLLQGMNISTATVPSDIQNEVLKHAQFILSKENEKSKTQKSYYEKQETIPDRTEPISRKIGASERGRLQRLSELTKQSQEYFGEETNTIDKLYNKYQNILATMGIKKIGDTEVINDAELIQKIDALKPKEKAFIESSFPFNELENLGSKLNFQEAENARQEEKGRVPVVPPERRKNIEKRKRIEEMTHEEAQQALKYDELTGLKSRRAWEDAEKQPVQGIFDVDGLKYANENFGYEGGDKLLKTVSDALTASGIEAFRIGGDEIRAQATNKKELENKIEKAYTILKDKSLRADLPDGSKIRWEGLGFSYGLSEAKSVNPEDVEGAQSEAGSNLKLHKAERRKRGLRAERGEQPPGISREPAAGNEAQRGVTPTEEAPPPPPEPPAAPAAEPVVTPKPPPKTPAPQQQKPPAEPTVKQQIGSIISLVDKEARAREKELKKAGKKATKLLPKDLRKTVSISDGTNIPKDAKRLLDDSGEWEAAVWYNPEGQVVEVHLNENLSPDKFAEALYHEIPGHIGQRLVFADSPGLLNSMRQMYGAAKSRGDVDLKAIQKAYKADIEKAGERGDDLLFEEWTAHNLHRYLIQNDKASLPTRVYTLVRAALVKIGVVREKVDDVLRSMIKKMSKAKDIGVLEGEITKGFKRPTAIYDLESAKALAEEYGLEYFGTEPAPGGPNYLFTDKKTGTTFKAQTRDEVNKAMGDLADRIAPKGTVKSGEGIRYKRPIGEEEGATRRSPEQETRRSPEQETPAERSVSEGVVNLDVDDETKWGMMARVAADRYHRLYTLVKQAEKETGVPVPDELNAYAKNDIVNSKIKHKADSFGDRFIDPIMDIAVRNKLDLKGIDNYLYALHAPEANRVVGERRPDMVEQGLPASGMSDEKAASIITAAEESGKIEAYNAISDLVQQWNKARLDMMVEDGLISKELRDQYESQYEHYVPLKGINDYDFEEAGDGKGKKGKKKQELPRTGKGLSIGGREYKMRQGRITEATDLMAHLASDTVEKAIRGEKNKIIRSLYEFNQKYKNNLIMVEPVVLKQVFNDKKGIFETKKLSNFEIGLTNKYGVPLDLKIDGKPFQMIVKDVPLQRALVNMGSEGADVFAKVLSKGIMPAQRYLAMVRTQLSINFIPSNALRDTMTAQLNALGLNLPEERQKGLALDILKNVLPSMKYAYEGQTGAKTEGAATYDDFVKNGGAIEFFGLKDVDAVQKQLVNQLKTMKPGALGASKRLMKNAFEYVTILNGSVENANRLATYTQLVKRGVSKQKAAYIAKNITVNFNRKGEMGSLLNAWALFANAGIQGSVRIVKTLIDSPTVRRIAGGIVLSSLAHAELMRMLAGDDPEDKENYYDKVSDFTRDTHLLVPLGKLVGKKDKGYIRIPLPYGYNVFWAFGQHTSRVIHGGIDKLPEESLHMLGAIADAFNPIGGAVDMSDPKSIVRNFTPTLAQPLAEIAVNQNFMGAPTYKESPRGYGSQPVASHSALKSTPEALQKATAWANDITGGGAYRPGAVNISPDIVNHLWNFATGGVGKLGTDLINIPFEWVSNKQVPAKTIPLVQRFYGEINEYKDVKKLYDNLDKAQRIYKDFEKYRTEDPEKARTLQRKYPGVIFMYKKTKGEFMTRDGDRTITYIPMNRLVIKRLKEKNELRKTLEERGNKEGVKRVEKQIVNLAQTWNAKLEKMMAGTTKAKGAP